jgi:hypothetical protein
MNSLMNKMFSLKISSFRLHSLREFEPLWGVHRNLVFPVACMFKNYRMRKGDTEISLYGFPLEG